MGLVSFCGDLTEIKKQAILLKNRWYMLIRTEYITANCSGISNDGGKFVVPCVMIVEGVLNGALVTMEALSSSLYQWEGKPVVISHPTDQEGAYISAANPETYQTRLIGFVFGARIEGDKLIADLHLDEKMICKAGHCELSERIKRGEKIEVSTGYACDIQDAEGDYNGIAYSQIQSHFEPDHLAILVDEVGACSIADGCGTNRVGNSKKHFYKGAKMKKEFVEKVKVLRANEKLTAEQFELIMAMDEEQAALAAALMSAVSPAKVETDDVPAVEGMSEEEIEKKVDEVVANRLADAIERHDMIKSIAANSGMTAEDLKPLTTNALRKMAANQSVADYSGQGGFGASRSGDVVIANAAVPVGIQRRAK